MARTKKNVKNFYLDNNDVDALEWCKNQRNLSESIRRLIKNAVAESGTGDYIDELNNRLNRLEGRKPIYVSNDSDSQINKNDIKQHSKPAESEQIKPDVSTKTNEPDESLNLNSVNLLGIDK